MKKLILIIIMFFVISIRGNNMTDQNNKIIIQEITVNAEIEDAYNAWTTKKGMQTFFAPECEVELKLLGKYRVHFFPENPPGSKGAEDEIVISFQKNKMFSFTWGFPPSLPDLRDNQKTIVTLRFEDLGNNKTKIVFTQSGWGEGEDWEKGFMYFEKAWKDVVLKRFAERFEKGPVDWNN